MWHAAQGGAQGSGARGAHRPGSLPAFLAPPVYGAGRGRAHSLNTPAACAGAEEVARGSAPRVIAL